MVGHVVKEGFLLACIGLVIGLLGAYFVGRAMRTMLFGVGAMDLSAFGTVGLVLLFAALLACYLPARRAASANPMDALRGE
jgi:putative ABC transport system permease protein